MAAGIVLSIEDIRAVRPIAMEAAVRTPLVALRGTDIHLKLENLQPIGSFKIRGAHAQIEALRPAATLTASAGNMAQAVAFCSRRLGIACTVVVPDHAPRAKTDAEERLGGRVIRVPFERWWAGSPRTIEYRKSFVDGIGAKAVFPEMFEAARGLLDGVATASVDEIRAAVRDIVLEARVVPEGAGAVALAVARRMSGRIACIVSGGSIDGAVLAEILS